MRIKMTNGGNTIYGIITKVGTYGGDQSGYTYITFLHEIDPTDSLALYLMANSAITNPYYSPVKCPYGFPMSPAKWSVEVSYSSQVDTGSATFVAFDTTNLKLDVPIGSWELSWKGVAGVLNSDGTEALSEFAFSSSQTSISDSDLHYYLRVTGASSAIRDYRSVYMKMIKEVSSKTPYYLIGKFVVGNSCYVYGQLSTTILRATCAYL
jgi:hypothetical protein